MSQEFEPQGHPPAVPVGSAPAAPHRPAPVVDDTAKTPFPLVLGGLMALTLVGSWLAQGWPAEAAPAPAPAAAAPADKPDSPADKPATTATAPSEDGKGLKDEIAALTARIDGLQGKVEGMSKDAPSGDLKSLQAKVDDLSKVPDMVKALPEKLDALDGKIGAFGKDLDGLKAQVASIQKGKDTATAPKVAEAAPTDADAGDAAMSDAAAMFKAKKYKEASAAFAKLAQSKANDARILYFAALSNGFATNNWTGETLTLVKKGVDQEKAGSPASSKIDEAFADLTKANGKDWLDGYRKQAKP